MKFRKIILALILASSITGSRGQTQVAPDNGFYSVDKQIDLQLKRFPMVDTGRLKNSMKIKVFWDNNSFFDQTLDCFTKSSLRNDTIYIIGHMTGQLGYGFQLILFKDRFNVASFGLSDGKIYKYNKSATDSTDFIHLPNVTQKVILSKKPTFQKGEIVAGTVKLKSVPFYYTVLEGKFKIELSAYFKTAPLKEIQ